MTDAPVPTGGARPEATPALPLRSSDPAAMAAHRVISEQLARLRKHLPGAREGNDPEELHDMRVATRRLRSALDLFRTALPPRAGPRTRKEVAWLGRLLGAVRDLDVQIGRLAGYAEYLPETDRAALIGLDEHLRARRGAARARMLAGLDDPRCGDLLEALERLGRGPAHYLRSDDETIAEMVHGTLKRRLRRLLAYGDALADAPGPEGLHRLRIRAKQLRYLLEFLREPAGPPGRTLAKRLVRIQDRLGAHQDALVAAEVISAYLRGDGASAAHEHARALECLIGHEVREASRMRADFPRLWRWFRGGDLRDLRRVLLRRF